MEGMTIGKTARAAGVGVETIRFYERVGLIRRPPRRTTGYRIYPRETVDRIRFIRRSKALGFSLKEIRDLLDLRLSPRTSCSDIRRRVEAKAADIDERITALRKMRTALTKLAAACRSGGPVGTCPILEALKKEGKR